MLLLLPAPNRLHGADYRRSHGTLGAPSTNEGMALSFLMVPP